MEHQVLTSEERVRVKNLAFGLRVFRVTEFEAGQIHNPGVDEIMGMLAPAGINLVLALMDDCSPSKRRAFYIACMAAAPYYATNAKFMASVTFLVGI